MCGIAGKFNFDPARPIDRERLMAMTTAIAHRGPDSDGFYVSAGIGLGHRRLSIIDLTTGDQPLTNDKFVLEQPPGAQVIRLGAQPATNASGSNGGGGQ